ncbi:hypothetical protein QTO34_013417, partial [Cnephaeus nilssonii]
MDVTVKIPEELKPCLVEDWELVTRQKQLFQLPAKKNVDAILEEYASCKKSQRNVKNRNTHLWSTKPRLFVRIGAILAYTPLDEKSLRLLLGYLCDILKYLAKNAASLFTASDYKVALAAYHRKARQALSSPLLVVRAADVSSLPQRPLLCRSTAMAQTLSSCCCWQRSSASRRPNQPPRVPPPRASWPIMDIEK